MSAQFDLRETRGEVAIEWKIKNFRSLPKEPGYCMDSSTFLLSDAKWFIRIYPNGNRKQTIGWLSLYLYRKCSPSPQHDVNYTIGIQNRDGSVHRSMDLNNEYEENGGYGVCQVVKTSELQKSKDILDSEGALTIFCIARVRTTTRLLDTKVVETACQTSSLKSFEILQENFKDLLLSGRDGDLIFKVKDQEFQAHRLVLATRSPVFSSMFDHDTAEKKSGIVNITDLNPEYFRDFLLFLYTGQLDMVSSSNAVDLYQAANKYDLQDLKNECVHCMAEKLCIESFCNVILLATTHNESKLVETATDFFTEHVKTILATPEWKSLETEHSTLTNELLIKMENRRFINRIDKSVWITFEP